MLKHLFMTSSVAILLATSQGWAQSPPPAPPPAAPAAVSTTQPEPAFTQAELETLVGPVALYPDTLLMQILVSATAPLDVMKADQYLQNNAGVGDDQRKEYVNSQDWDESVKVLATAFPDVIGDMADHIDWTESMGDAMLAQSDDVMKAIQTMRRRAIDNGSLISGAEQQVSFLEDAPATSTTTSATAGSSDAAERPVVITPTDPQKVYVPQYDTHEVYSNNLGNIVATTAVAFGTAALIDDIFDDDDDWDGYWGCRDCGGWNGQPIIRDPNINLDVDGNVRIGNEVNIDRDRIRADRDKIAWKPDQSKVQSARTRIDQKRQINGGRLTSVNKNASVQDDLRRKLQDRPPGRAAAGNAAVGSAAARANLNRRPQIDRPSHFSPEAKAKAVNRTKAQAHRPSTAAHHRPAAAKKPVAHRAQHPKKPVVHHQASHHAKPTAIKRQASGAHTRAASHRGHASRGHSAHRR